MDDNIKDFVLEDSFPGSEISGELLDFIKAVDIYRTINRRKFPALSEYFEIFLSLGYRKVAKRTAIPRYSETKKDELLSDFSKLLELQVKGKDWKSLQIMRVMKALADNGGSKRKAAKELGISRQGLYKILNKFKLKVKK